MGKTKISWTNRTWNPWMGCKKVSVGCKNCFMFRDQIRYGGDPTEIRRSKTTFNEPLKWKNPELVFTCSWSDFFIEDADEWRDDAWDIIRRTPHLTYQIPTKRPERIENCLPDLPYIPHNVWWGISAENQETLEKRWTDLNHVFYMEHWPLRFISAEPLLGPLDLSKITPLPNWVIVGGESGPGYRKMDIEWARNIKEDCDRAGVAFFMKQDSGLKPGMKGRIPDDLWIQEFPGVSGP